MDGWSPFASRLE